MTTDKPAITKLTKRAMRQSDSDAIYAILCDPAIRVPFGLFDEGHFDKDAVRGWCTIAGEYNRASKGASKFYVIENGGEVIGYFGGVSAEDGPPEKSPRWEIGYFLDARYQGQGIVPHLLSDYIEAARKNPLTREFYAVVKSDNGASRHVLEKNGFVKTGVDEAWTPFIFHKDGSYELCPPLEKKMDLFTLKL